MLKHNYMRLDTYSRTLPPDDNPAWVDNASRRFAEERWETGGQPIIIW